MSVENQRYQIDESSRGSAGFIRAFDRVLQRWVVLKPASSSSRADGSPRSIVQIDGQEYLAYVDTESTQLEAGATLPRAAASRRFSVALCVVSVLIIAIGAGTWWLATGRWDEIPTTVAVLLDRAASAGSRGESTTNLIGVAIEAGAIDAVASLEGLYALAGRDVTSVASRPVEIMKAVGAQRILCLSMQDGGDTAIEVAARLLRADGVEGWASRFAVPVDQPAMAAEAMRRQVASAFPQRRSRGGGEGKVKAEDYSDYLMIRGGLMTGKLTYESALADLEDITARSPSLLEAVSLEVSLDCYLFRRLGDRDYLDNAQSALGNIDDSVADNYRIVLARTDLSITANELPAARAWVDTLAAVAPQHPHLAQLQAQVDALEGNTGGAIAVLRDAVSRMPRWFDLLALADLELKEGERQRALEHLEAAEDLAPQQAHIKNKRCEAELTYGSPAAAEQLLVEVISTMPQGQYSINLGIARLLQGKTEAARDAFETARELGCELPLLRVYEADTAELLGDSQRAQELYSLAIQELSRPTQAPDPFRQLNLAYCMARVGQTDTALEVLDTAAVDSGASPHVAYSAMLIHSLCGLPDDARRDETVARAQGLGDPWFELASRLLPAAQ